MKNKYIYLIVGILVCTLVFADILAVNPTDNVKKSNSQNILASAQAFEVISSGANGTLKASNSVGDKTGCCTVLLHVKSGYDILSYRRDSSYEADMHIDKIDFNGQTAITEYKLQNGAFTHTIITQNGWVITMGGNDYPVINKELVDLGSNITSQGHIEEKDLDSAKKLLKIEELGHFVIKAPDGTVGLVSYDQGSSVTELFKMNDGEFIRINNNPTYYETGEFQEYGQDPVNDSIKIAGLDPFGLHRRDIITYNLTENNNSSNLNIWASFDGGAFFKAAGGQPDNIIYMGNTTNSTEIPKIPNKKFLGEQVLQNKTVNETKKQGLSFDSIISQILVLLRLE